LLVKLLEELHGYIEDLLGSPFVTL